MILLGEGFHAVRRGDDVTISGGKTGLLYGAYRLLIALASGSALPEDHSSAPQYALRMINCWDNADGSVERGYSGAVCSSKAASWPTTPRGCGSWGV